VCVFCSNVKVVLNLVSICTVKLLSLYVFICTDVGTDFTPGVFEATFVAMSTSNGDTACDTITIIDDNVVEGDHSFEIQIVSTDPLLSIINPVSAMVTIQDNEGDVVFCIIITK